ncbi:acyl-CoA dehydrogenase [Kutzneria sp. NPDC052558]|uniref:acyl-CoA dehydrogenase family protein n=1 Tax=Kutzneria sp. NPDC052558 TaxID=3364121 RepID=UPI0037C77518
MEPSAITEILDGRWADLRRTVREQLAGVDYREASDLSTAEHRALVFDQLHALAKTDGPRLGFDREYGGGGDIGGSVVAFETLGFGDLSLMVKAGVQWGLFGGAVQLLGTRRHHERYLADIMDLTLPGCFAMTETGHGSDVQHLRTTATYDGSEFVLHTPHQSARKDYIGNAARDGRAAVVFAQLITDGRGRGVHAFLVPIRDTEGNPLAGVSIEDCGRKGGLNGVDNGRLSFDHVRVPRENLLDHYGQVDADGTYRSPIDSDNRRFFTMLGTLIRGRVSVAGSAGSAAKRALTIAVRYADTRRQFNRPDDAREVVLLDYQSHQRKLLPALATTYAMHFAQEELTATLHELQSTADPDDRRQRELESRAAGIKALSTWHATAAIQTCREACGGAGYLAENLLTTLKADTDVFTTFEGDNTVLLQLVAKGLLTNYRSHFEDLGTLATARFVAEQFVGMVTERLPNIGRDDADALHDRAWQLRAFEDREAHVLDGLARRLRRAASGDADPFEVFNSAQDHVLRAGRAHTERVVLQAFADAVERSGNPLLDRLCSLYALHVVNEDLGWFLAHGRLTTGRGKAVNGAVNALCAELRPHARTLVDAFAIPERFLDAAVLREEPGRQSAQWQHDQADNR